MKRITTRNFDDQARTYVAAKHRKESAEEEMKKLKDPFVAFLKKHGAVPETGKKSFAYLSELYRALISFGETATVESEAAEAFRAEFNKRGRAVSFSDIFKEDVKYVAMPGGALAVQQLPKKLQQLYRRTRKIKPQAPSLKIERLEKPAA